jgi:signal transduction histidine kinase
LGTPGGFANELALLSLAANCDRKAKMIGDRRTGLESIDSVPWGTHMCGFYGTRQDLTSILAPYFAAGIQEDEFCILVTSDPLSVDEAKTELRHAIPDLDQYLDANQIEIWDYRDWYLKGGRFDADRVFGQWFEKEKKATERGYQGFRAAGNLTWLEKKDWPDFMAYEAEVNRSVSSRRMVGLCTYCTESCEPDAVLDVIRHHQFTLSRISGEARLRTQASLSIQLQQLSARLLDLQDQARRRISKQLHEETAQNLFGLSLSLANLQRQRSLSDLEPIVADCQMLCEQSLKQIRAISHRLHPPILDLAGLASALRAYIDGFVKENNIQVEFVQDPRIGRLTLKVETDLFRVAQEGLLNVVRHSGSPVAIVRFERRANLAVLEIEDFGRGIPPAVMDALSGVGEIGVGLLGMRERLRQIGGSLEIRSHRKGTVVTASVPLPD